MTKNAQFAKKKSHNSCKFQKFFVSLQAICVNMSKKFVILLFCALFMSVPRLFAGSTDTLHTTYVVNSDYVPTHVVTLSLGGGMHAMMPTLSEDAKNTVGLGSTVGVGGQFQALYTFYIIKYVGITAGVGFDMYTGNMKGEFHDRVWLYDKHNKMNYWLNSDYTNFKESEQLYMVTVPVGVTGRINLTDPIQLRGTLGLGMNVIASSHFRGEGQLTTTADYPDYNLHFDPDLPQHGFSNYYMGGYEGKIENTFPVSMFVFFDFGMHYQFTKRYGIYAGVYFNYTCFSSIRPTTDAAGNRPELVTFDSASKQWTYSGMLNSKFVEAINPLSVGVKVGFTLTFLDPARCNCEKW